MNGEDSTSDRSLLIRLQGGSREAPTQLYMRYARRLRALAARKRPSELAAQVEPDDIVQSVFRTFFRRAVTGHYTVPDGKEIWNLLLVIALNKIRSACVYHRAAKRNVSNTVRGAAYEAALQTTSHSDDGSLAVLQLVIEELLSTLPESHRRIVELRIEGHEVQEIASLSERSKRTTERVLQDFRERLAALIDKQD